MLCYLHHGAGDAYPVHSAMVVEALVFPRYDCIHQVVGYLVELDAFAVLSVQTSYFSGFAVKDDGALRHFEYLGHVVSGG